MNYLRFFRNISTQYLLWFSHEFSHKSNYPSMILHDAPEKKSRVLMNVNSFLEYFVRRTNQQTKVEPGGGKRMRSVSANRFSNENQSSPKVHSSLMILSIHIRLGCLNTFPIHIQLFKKYTFISFRFLIRTVWCLSEIF